jgi:hypothetical protein
MATAELSGFGRNRIVSSKFIGRADSAAHNFRADHQKYQNKAKTLLGTLISKVKPMLDLLMCLDILFCYLDILSS